MYFDLIFMRLGDIYWTKKNLEIIMFCGNVSGSVPELAMSRDLQPLEVLKLRTNMITFHS